MIVCIAIVGQQNNPVYLRTFPPAEGEQLLKFNYVVHCALDALEEKVLIRRGPGESIDSYLGLLYPTEEYKLYGYLTNSLVKFIVVLDDATVKDEPISKVLKMLHNFYVDATSNPFHSFGLPIKSPRFDQQVQSIVASYHKSLQSPSIASMSPS